MEDEHTVPSQKSPQSSQVPPEPPADQVKEPSGVSPYAPLDETNPKLKVVEQPPGVPNQQDTSQKAPQEKQGKIDSIIRFIDKCIAFIGKFKDLLVILGLGVGVLVVRLQNAFSPWSPHFGFIFWPAVALVIAGLVGAILIIWRWLKIIWRWLKRHTLEWTQVPNWTGLFRDTDWLRSALCLCIFGVSFIVAKPRLRNWWQHRHDGFDVVGVVVTNEREFPPDASDFQHTLDGIKKEIDGRVARKGLALRVEWNPTLERPRDTVISLTSLQRLRRNEGFSAMLWVDCELDDSNETITGTVILQTEDGLLDSHSEGLRLGGVSGWDLSENPAEIKDLARDIWDAVLGYVALIHYAEGDYAGSVNYMEAMSILARDSPSAKSRLFFQEPFLFYVLLNTAYRMELFDWIAYPKKMLTPNGHEMLGSTEELGLHSLENLLRSGEVDNAVHPYLDLLASEIHVRLGHVGAQFGTERRLQQIINRATVTGGWMSLNESARDRLAAEAAVWLARAKALQGKTDEAQQKLDQAKQQDEGFWLPYFELARHFLSQSEYALALDALHKAQHRDPPNAALVKNWYGIAQYLNGDQEEAEAAWDHAEKLGQDGPEEGVQFFKPPNVVLVGPSAPITALTVEVFVAPEARSETSAVDTTPITSTAPMAHTPSATDTTSTTSTALTTYTTPATYTIALLRGGVPGEELARQTLKLNPESQTYEPTSFDLSPLLERCRLSCEAGCPEIKELYVLALYSGQPSDRQELLLKVRPFILSVISSVRLQVWLEGALSPSGEVEAVYGQPVPVKAEIVADYQRVHTKLKDKHALSRLWVLLEVENIHGESVARLPLTPTVDPYSQVISYGGEFPPPGLGTYLIYGVVSDTIRNEIVLKSEPITLTMVMPTPTPIPTFTPSPTPKPTATPTPSPTPTPAPPLITVVWIRVDAAPAYYGRYTKQAQYQLKRCQLFLLRHRPEEVGRAELQWLGSGLNTVWTDSADYERWRSITRDEFEKLGALAVCRQDGVQYTIERGAEKVLPLGECNSQCTVFEVLAQEKESLLIRGQVGEVHVEGWVKAEDMDVYELKDLDLSW